MHDNMPYLMDVYFSPVYQIGVTAAWPFRTRGLHPQRRSLQILSIPPVWIGVPGRPALGNCSWDSDAKGVPPVIAARPTCYRAEWRSLRSGGPRGGRRQSSPGRVPRCRSEHLRWNRGKAVGELEKAVRGAQPVHKPSHSDPQNALNLLRWGVGIWPAQKLMILGDSCGF